MNLFTSKELYSLHDLLLDQLRDLYDAEQRLVKALPKLAESAEAAGLKRAFENHLNETEGHVTRLEQIFRQIGAEDTKRETCLAMKGLIDEGTKMVDAYGVPSVKDAALIAAAQRVEHYEMAGYGTARTFAFQLNMPEVANLLQRTLEEEKAANETLTSIAETQVNVQAASV